MAGDDVTSVDGDVSPAARALLDRIDRAVADLAEDRPLVVAVDGRSGTGKSTLVAEIALHLAATVVEGDDFYRGGSLATWRAMSPARRAATCVEWRRQRPVLSALREGHRATWDVFDWAHPAWDADEPPVLPDAGAAEPAPVCILEGVYAARPELADLLDLRVWTTVPEPVRLARLREREGQPGPWDALWTSAEEVYAAALDPGTSLDLVVDLR